MGGKDAGRQEERRGRRRSSRKICKLLSQMKGKYY